MAAVFLAHTFVSIIVEQGPAEGEGGVKSKVIVCSEPCTDIACPTVMLNVVKDPNHRGSSAFVGFLPSASLRAGCSEDAARNDNLELAWPSAVSDRGVCSCPVFTPPSPSPGSCLLYNRDERMC